VHIQSQVLSKSAGVSIAASCTAPKHVQDSIDCRDERGQARAAVTAAASVELISAQIMQNLPKGKAFSYIIYHAT
jgi:hypothetical protein